MSIKKKMQTFTIDDFTQDGEQWAFIPDYPNYFVSNMGRVYTGYENHILCGDYNKKGYHRVQLKGVDGAYKTFRVSHLVAAAFIPWYNPAKHKEIHHINNNEADDRLINLLPVTRLEHLFIHNFIYKRLLQYPSLIIELFKRKKPELQIIIRSNNGDDDMKGGDAA